MSSAGQAAGGIVGAVAGFFVGGPTGALYGAQIGMTVGSIIDPPKGPDVKGPRLDDLTVQTSTYGVVIPRIYGTLAVTGNVFWLENNKIKEEKKKKSSGGKGGGSQTTTTTFSYSATFAVGLCHCTTKPIVGVRRVWIAGRLWYDAGSSDLDAIAVSNSASKYFTLYTGSDTQMPDDRMQATLGVANTPAYRGLAYVVFKDLPLAEYSNSLMAAQVKVEVVADGGAIRYQESAMTMPYGYWADVVWNGRIFCAITMPPYASAICATSPDGVTWTQHPLPIFFNYSSIAWNGKYFCIVGHDSRSLVSRDGVSWSIGAMPSAPVTDWTGLSCKDDKFVAFGYLKTGWSIDGLTWLSGTIFSSIIGVSGPVWNGSIFVAPAIEKAYVLTSGDGISWETTPLPVSDHWCDLAWNGSVFCMIASNSAVCLTSPDGISWTQRALPTSRAQDRITACGADFAIMGWADWNLYVSSDNGVSWATYRINLQGLYGAAWDGAHLCLTTYGGTTAFLVTPYQIASASPTLGSIIQSEVEQSNLLTSADINVSALTQPVRGYRISSVAALRSGIDPLQGAWPFDVIQSGYVIKFKKRGSASVATIPADDLDARTSDQEPGVSITNVREMDSVLPQRVRVSFMDFDREYDVNEQSDARLNTDSVNVSSIDLSIVLTCGEAAGITQVLLYLYWMERYDVHFSLPPTYARLEPGDVVTVQASEGTYSLRLTAITYTQDGRLECSAKYNSAAIYTPTAVGASGSATPQTLTRVGSSVLALLDIPLLVDSSDHPGYIAAMTGALPGWQGGAFYRSDDAGQTWSAVQGVSAPGADIGYASNTIGAGRTDIIDASSALIVSMVQGELSSVTESAMLNGANYFAYGVDGRWEIIAARTCALQADGSYLLTDMLRGRKGTEWACGLHAAGDIIVAMDSTSVDFISVSLDSIGAARTYRGVTAGQELEAASDLDFTYAGVNLECLAPCYANGSRNTSGDWALTWVRRTRIGGEWRNYVDASLGEASESYSVEIYTSSAFTTIKRTATATTPSIGYTALQQTADFGTVQSALYLRIYQVSSTVGMGYPLQATVIQGVPSALLMHMDSAGLIDECGHAVTLGGSVTRSSAQSKFVGYSAYFDGVGDYLQMSSPDFILAGVDFTIEAWIYVVSLSTAFTITDSRSGTYSNGIMLVVSTSGAIGTEYRGDSGAVLTSPLSSAGAVSPGSWHHIALSRNGDQHRLFVDGAIVSTATEGSPYPFTNPSLRIGWTFDSNSGYAANGYVDELRLTKGMARYTFDFSASLPTDPFTE